jgi:small conductance mechanosensitive channel
LAVAVWEGVNAVLDNILHRADYKESMRLQTVMPIIRNVIFIGFMVMFTLILLSELGINVIPLMAGAGVLGIAIGFGAQTMVKDFLTGFTIILEDLIQVGDVVTLGGKTGLIEKITIRKVQMRDLSGIVYTIPFGDVTIIENMTKNFSYYVMDIGVAYREDTDEVVALLREIDEDMRQDENFKNLILEPIEILGVDAFADSAVIIKARIKTRPIKQWDVGREFNRRMKYKFDEHGIEIPFPHQTIYFGVDKDGTAPPAPIKIEKETG